MQPPERQWKFAIIVGLSVLAAVMFVYAGIPLLVLASGFKRDAEARILFTPVVMSIATALDRAPDGWDRPLGDGCTHPLGHFKGPWGLHDTPPDQPPTYLDCIAPFDTYSWTCTTYHLLSRTCITIAVHKYVLSQLDVWNAMLETANDPCRAWKNADGYASYFAHSLPELGRPGGAEGMVATYHRECTALKEYTYVFLVMDDNRRVISTKTISKE